ncbi:unnamed protein product, partial [Allacma fusca]
PWSLSLGEEVLEKKSSLQEEPWRSSSAEEVKLARTTLEQTSWPIIPGPEEEHPGEDIKLADQPRSRNQASWRRH